MATFGGLFLNGMWGGKVMTKKVTEQSFVVRVEIAIFV